MFKRAANLLIRFFHAEKTERELSAEVQSYLDLLAEEKIRTGMSPEAARRAARIELGGIEQVKEEIREVKQKSWFEPLLQDLHYATRTLRKNPGFTLVCVLTLALGIGANTAIFSVIESVLLRPLPFEQPKSLIEVWNSYMPTIPLGGLSAGDYRDWTKAVTTVSEMGGYSWVQQGVNLTGDGDPQQLQVRYATSSLFPMLGLRPAIGRSFVPEEDRANAAPAVMLTHRLWQSRYRGDPAVLNREVLLDGQRCRVIGVLPASSQLLDQADIWMAWGQFPDDLNGHIHHSIIAIARLKPGVSIGQARAEFESLNTRSAGVYPAEHKNFGVVVRPMQDPSAAGLRQSLLILFAAVGLVLLIACANIVNLLLARNAAREREMALRTALGAGPWRLARQLMTESVVLAVLGGGLAVVLAVVGVSVLGKLVPARLAAVGQTHIDATVFLFTVGISLFVGFSCGLLPALLVRKTNANDALKQGGRTGGSFGPRKIHNTLVVAEIALALVPLIGSGLLLRSLQRLMEVDPGFRAESLLTMQIPQAAIPPQLSVADQTKLGIKRALEFEQIASHVSALPGVEAAAGIDVLPLNSASKQETRFVVEDQPQMMTGARPIAEFRTVSLGYFSAVGMPLISGRTFNQGDWSSTNIMVNQTIARRFWPNGNVEGKRINICTLAPQPCWFSIVGVVGNVHEFDLDASPTYDIYFSGGWTPYLVVRTAQDPHRLAAIVIDVVHKEQPSLPVADVKTADELLSNSVSPRRFSAVLIGVFAALALLLAAIGIHGVMSYMVSRRIQEIGVRAALGAQPRDVLLMVVGHGMRLTLLGITVGTLGALALTRWMKSLLYQVSATDPATFAGVVILLALVALAACYVPTRRAMRVDPMIALRYE
jgi:putative ABC transport system permease protein